LPLNCLEVQQPAMNEPRLVIFDCDGVLVDSELIANRVLAQMLNELGLPVTLDYMFERFMGRSMSQCCEFIVEMLKGPVPEGFVQEYHARTALAFQYGLKAVAGIEASLDSIESMGVPYCVASSGSHEKMRTTLGITGLLPRFEGSLFSVAEVSRGKPAPDVFLYAASRHSVAPSACCVIEDTPTGVAAGVAAGMTVYGYCALTPRHRLLEAGACRTFNDMRKLPDLLFGTGVSGSGECEPVL
jgi:HAD superfamily hydrolase (TIGR01509 family)